jgi:hypothetical protein
MVNGGLSANNAGPSAMRLYDAAGKENVPANTGLDMGSALYANDLAARTKFATPSVPGDTRLADGNQARQDRLAGDYNFGEALPVKYDVPDAYKEHFQAKEDLVAGINAAGLGGGEGGQVVRNVTVGEDEVQYLQSMKKQAELADFDRYVNTLIDPRKPGNLKWLMEIYPEYVNRRIQQVHTDYEFALRNQMIDSWGINTFDDLHFKYLVDQGKVDGPRLERRAVRDDEYAAGLLSPWHFQHSPGGSKLKLPFTSAQYGKRPDNPAQWQLSDDNQPLARAREPQSMSRAMYDKASVFNANQRGPGRLFGLQPPQVRGPGA